MINVQGNLWVPDEGYKYITNGEVTIWHMGSTDVDEAINFVCFKSELVEDIPEPKTRSEFYDYTPAGYNAESLPEPLTRKEFYSSLLAGHTPTKKKVLFSGYGKYEQKEIPLSRSTPVDWVLIVPKPASYADKDTIIMVGNTELGNSFSWDDWYNMAHCFRVYNDSEIWIHVSSEADAANKVVIFKTVELTPPQPKTATEFYLAKMAGIEVVGNLEKVFEQEFTFGTEPDSKGNYDVTISNVYDEAVDVSRFIKHIDGNDNYSFEVDVGMMPGAIIIRASDASYAGTTHTLELFYKTVIEDVPVKTRTEQYLKAIAANQNSNDSSESKG